VQGIQKTLETNAAKPFIGFGCFFFKRRICPKWPNSGSAWSQFGHGLTAPILLSLSSSESVAIQLAMYIAIERGNTE
jgi:hypothetical protein